MRLGVKTETPRWGPGLRTNDVVCQRAVAWRGVHETAQLTAGLGAGFAADCGTRESAEQHVAPFVRDRAETADFTARAAA